MAEHPVVVGKAVSYVHRPSEKACHIQLVVGMVRDSETVKAVAKALGKSLDAVERLAVRQWPKTFVNDKAQ